MFDKRYFSLGVIIYIIATYLGLKFDVCPGKSSSAVFVFSLCFIFVLTIVSAFLYYKLSSKRKASRITAPSDNKTSFSSVRTSSYVLIVYSVVVIFAIGFMRTYSANIYYKQCNAAITENPNVYGVVTGEAKISSSGLSYAFNTEVIYFDTADGLKAPSKPIRTVTYIPVSSVAPAPSVGDTFKCSYRFEIDSDAAFTGAFDYTEYLKQSKISYAGYSYDYAKTEIDGYSPSAFRKLCNLGYKLRFAIIKSFGVFPYAADELSLLKGILLGDTGSFSDELYTTYTDSGLIHIAAVSGMHTSYLFLAISAILSLMRVPRRLYALFAIPILTLFAATALFTPSVNRAVIMLAVLLMSSVFNRKNDSITALSFAAFIIILNNPYSIKSYSFLLSFGATLGLLIYSNPINQKLSALILPIKNNKITKPLFSLSSYITNSVSLSLSGTIGISYFSAAFFGRISLGGIFGNLIIFPTVAIIFIAGFLSSLLFYICKPLSAIISAFILNPALKLTNLTASFFSNPRFLLSSPHPDKIFFLIYLVICFYVYILLSSKQKK